MLRLLKPLSFLPAVLMMYIIFSFSSQDGATSADLSYKVSYKIVEVSGKILGEEFEPWQIDSIATRYHGIVRKLAHMTEYFLLAIAVSFPFYVYGLRGIWLMLVAGFICVSFACGDEYHQSYVAGRSPSKRDVLIDSFGVFWGIILVRIVGWTGRKTIFRPWFKKKTPQTSLNQSPTGPYSPNLTYPDQEYQDHIYQDHVYQDHIYQDHVYQDHVYQDHVYQDHVYQDHVYQDHVYQDRVYQNPYYTNVPYSVPRQTQIDEFTSSDSLSEDLSFRKLMHNLKNQQREHD